MATVLKSQQRQEASTVTGLAGFNLDDLAAGGRLQIEQARREAELILAQARKDATALREQAQQAGRQAGVAEGRADADRQIADAVKQQMDRRMKVMQQTVDQLAVQQSQWLAEFAQTLTGLALAAAERIVQRRLQQEPEIVLTWTEQALRHARSARSLVVAVHPETLAQQGNELEALLGAAGLPEVARVEPDESVERCGVVIRQDGGAVDAQLTTQLQQLEAMLR